MRTAATHALVPTVARLSGTLAVPPLPTLHPLSPPRPAASAAAILRPPPHRAASGRPYQTTSRHGLHHALDVAVVLAVDRRRFGCHHLCRWQRGHDRRRRTTAASAASDESSRAASDHRGDHHGLFATTTARCSTFCQQRYGQWRRVFLPSLPLFIGRFVVG